MNRIKKVTPRSRNSDISALLTLLLNAFNENDWSSDNYLSPIISELENLNKQLIEALERLQRLSQLTQKDEVRDAAIQALFKLVEGYTYIPIAELKTAAETIQNVLTPYGIGIRHKSHDTESAAIESLLNDLKKPELTAAIAQLQGVQATITTLEEAQQAFEDLVVEQAENKDLQKDLTTATQLKKESLTLINNNLVGYLNTMAKVNPDTYKAITGATAELIDRNNMHVKNRKENEAEG